MPKPRAALVLLLLLALPARSPAQDRRDTPGLKLEPPGRTGSCDALLFTSRGGYLLAAGDDKVVRIWPVTDKGIEVDSVQTLRWRIYREQRGGIHAVALSPDGRSLAVGGYGAMTGEVTILNRDTGEVKYSMDRPISKQPTWALAWSPDARYVVIGSTNGDLYRWEPTAGRQPMLFAGSMGKAINRVRLIAFLDRTRFLSVAMDGVVYERDVTQPAAKPHVRGRFENKDLFRVAFSPSKAKPWLAATPDHLSANKDTEIVELLDLSQAGPGKKASRTIPLHARGLMRSPTAMAFDPTGEYLAVGTQDSNLAVGKLLHHVTGGKVFVYKLTGGEPKLLDASGLDISYRVDNVAFRPNHPGHLATAGGPNHEVSLWDFTRGAALSTVRSPGSCLWQVAFSTNNHYLGWKEQLNNDAKSPNDRGKGDWRVFNLDVSKEHKVRQILPAAPKDFEPVRPIEQLEGWSVERTANGYVWNVLGPGGLKEELSEKTGLYLTPVNQIPRCYTFLRKTNDHPVRLAVGHMWGVTIYDLRPGKVSFARMLVGHEGEVMSVAPSRDGKLLVTASRDQTISCWSLEKWPNQRELGANFTASKGNTITVRNVAPGSPAWEAGLTDGDEVVLIASTARDRQSSFVFDPEKRGVVEQGEYVFKPKGSRKGLSKIEAPRPTLVDQAEALRRLAAAEPAREYIFVWKHNGKEQQKLTTVRQRPLWRFFPTRRAEGSNWILWRWRDFYYDTNSAEPDRLVGWHVNPPADQPRASPEFHPLSRFASGPRQQGVLQRRGFHDPGRVWRTVKEPFQNPRKWMFPEIEPPKVTVSVESRPPNGVLAKLEKPLRVRITVQPRNDGPQQKIVRVTLWLNDHDFREKPIAIGEQGGQAVVEIAPGNLRSGPNEITVTSFNAAGGRGEAATSFEYREARGKPNLFALCVGLTDYEPLGQPRLPCAREDATVLAEVFKQHQSSGLFANSEVALLRDQQATESAILSRLRKMGEKARPDDLLVLFLSGHGFAVEMDENDYDPGSFVFISADWLPKSNKGLQTAKLRDALAAIRCRKLVLLDACHSGAIVSDPIRDLVRDGAKFQIFSACTKDQLAVEPNRERLALKGNTELRSLKHGLFTEGLLKALGRPELAKGGRDKTVTAGEIQGTVEREIDRLLRLLGERPGSQTPVFEPKRMPSRKLLCKP